MTERDMEEKRAWLLEEGYSAWGLDTLILLLTAVVPSFAVQMLMVFGVREWWMPFVSMVVMLIGFVLMPVLGLYFTHGYRAVRIVYYSRDGERSVPLDLLLERLECLGTGENGGKHYMMHFKGGRSIIVATGKVELEEVLDYQRDDVLVGNLSSVAPCAFMVVRELAVDGDGTPRVELLFADRLRENRVEDVSRLYADLEKRLHELERKLQVAEAHNEALSEALKKAIADARKAAIMGAEEMASITSVRLPHEKGPAGYVRRKDAVAYIAIAVVAVVACFVLGILLLWR